MRCLACGLNMQVVQVEQDNTMFVPGYEHHTWHCDSCGEVERRLTFIPKNEVWLRTAERVRSKQAELREREDIGRAATERLARFNRDWRRSSLAARAGDRECDGS
jgi:hypothetical protein